MMEAFAAGRDFQRGILGHSPESWLDHYKEIFNLSPNDDEQTP